MDDAPIPPTAALAPTAAASHAAAVCVCNSGGGPAAPVVSYFSRQPESSLHRSQETPVKSAWKRTGFDEWEPMGVPQEDLSQVFRHSGWREDRARVYTALFSSSKSHHRLKAFCQCGMNAMVHRSKKGPEDWKVTALKCHDRFCKPCLRDRASKIKSKLIPALGTRRVRMLTLTVKADSTDKLFDCVKKLQRSFTQLRRLDIWREAVDGCAYFLEVTRGANHDHWHAHFHVLMVGSYLEVGWLSQAWRGITRDSFICHITLCRSVKGVALYCGKYATKGFDITTLRSPDLLQEAIATLTHAKLWGATGTLRKAMREAQANDYLTAAEWEPVASLHELFKWANDGDSESIRILSLLRVRDPVTREFPPWSEMPPPEMET
jgi:hypothetical protein